MLSISALALLRNFRGICGYGSVVAVKSIFRALYFNKSGFLHVVFCTTLVVQNTTYTPPVIMPVGVYVVLFQSL